jgi:hypothetical protein
MGGIAELNRRLLPALLAQTDIISVMPGQSLEEAFLIAKDVEPGDKLQKRQA